MANASSTTFGAAAAAALITRKTTYTRCASHAGDELRSFRSCLRWMCVDHSDGLRAAASWLVFLLLAVAVPAGAHLAVPGVDAERPYDAIVQLPLTLAAALAYLSLSALIRSGLRRLLYLDRLRHDSDEVRAGYTAQLSRSFRLLACFVLPCFLAEAAYKITWYCAHRPFPAAWSAAACALELASWIYRTAMFFMMCVLFRITCYLQILRMSGFARELGGVADVAAVLEQHRRIREQLRSISHRYRRFLLASLVLVTASQFAALLATTRPRAQVNVATAGELALCSISLVTGLLVCLRSAAKITHKTQAITSVAAGWHADVTIHAFDHDQENLSPEARINGYQVVANAYLANSSGDESDDDDDGSNSEGHTDGSKLIPFQANSISFQKRQALVTYLENNRAGITVFGFVIDRTLLHALFAIEFSLVMWLLGKTVGIS